MSDPSHTAHASGPGSSAAAFRARIAVAGVAILAIAGGGLGYVRFAGGGDTMARTVMKETLEKTRTTIVPVFDENRKSASIIANPEPPAPSSTSPTRIIPRVVKTIRVRLDGTMIEPADGEAEQTNAKVLRQTLNATIRPPSDEAGDVTGTIRSEPVPPNSIATAVARSTPVAAARSATPAAAAGDTIALAPPAQPAPAEAAISARTRIAPPRDTPGANFYFVQLAAAGSDDDAKRLSEKLQAGLADILGGRELVVQPANVKDRAVFRIRLSQLARDDANALCARIRGRNACFVSRE